MDLFDKESYLLFPIVGFIFLVIISIFDEKNKKEYFIEKGKESIEIRNNELELFKDYGSKEEYLQNRWNLMNKSYEILDEYKIKNALKIMSINEILNIYIDKGYQIYKEESVEFDNYYENYKYKIYYLQRVKIN